MAATVSLLSKELIQKKQPEYLSSETHPELWTHFPSGTSLQNDYTSPSLSTPVPIHRISPGSSPLKLAPIARTG